MARRDLMDVSARNHNLPAFIFIVARHGAIAETIKQIVFRNAKVGHMVNQRPIDVTVIRLTIIRPRHIKADGGKRERRKRVVHGISPLVVGRFLSAPMLLLGVHYKEFEFTLRLFFFHRLKENSCLHPVVVFVNGLTIASDTVKFFAVFHGISPLGGMPKTTIPFYAQRSTKIVKSAI